MSTKPPNLGPIRPEHEGNGWKLRGDQKGQWYLIKDFGGRYIGIISATTPNSCAWQITTRTGDLLREGSAADDVSAARSRADEWVAENPVFGHTAQVPVSHDGCCDWCGAEITTPVQADGRVFCRAQCVIESRELKPKGSPRES